MRFSIVNTIFNKELKEIFRDKPTLFFLILLPLFMYPILFVIMGQIGTSQQLKLKTTEVNLVVNENFKTSPLYDLLKSDDQFTISVGKVDTSELDSLKNTMGISIDEPYQQAIANKKSANVNIYFDGTSDLLMSKKRTIVHKIDSLRDIELENRLALAQLDSNFIEPIRVHQVDIAPESKKLGDRLGQYIPLLLLFLIFSGCVYIAVDITSGEKERKTLQSLFIAPIKISEIIAGKFLAIFVIGLSSAIANLLSLLITLVWQTSMASGASASAFNLSISIAGWLWLVLLLILSTVFIAAICMAVLLLANSYKESQSYISPLMLVVLTPGMLSIMPGMELDLGTVFVPILNVTLAMADIMKGVVNTEMLFLVTVISVVYAGLSLFLASLTFGDESVITGEKVSYQALLNAKSSGKNFFGVQEALVYYLVVLFLFITVGSLLQSKLDLMIGLPLSFFLILGGVSVAVISYFKLDIKSTLQINKPTLKATIATLLIACTAWIPVNYISMFFMPEGFAEMFGEAMEPLFEAHFLVGLALIALLPAVFEELVFRGLLFKGLQTSWSKWGVIITTAICFGLIHLSIYRLVPTIIMGLILGYVLWQSKSIILCSLLHFLHNGIAFTLGHFGLDEVENSIINEYALIVGALIITGLGLFLLSQENPDEPILVENT